MDDSLRADLHSARDVFLLMAENVDLYKSTERLQSATDALQRACEGAQQGVRDRVSLGILYAKRAHSDEEPNQLLAEVSNVARCAPEDVEVQRIARLVEAAILLLRLNEFARSLSLLKALQDELRTGPLTPFYGMVLRCLATAYSVVGRHRESDDAYHDALSIFRHYELRFSYACTLSDHGVLKRKIGQLLLAREMFKEALGIYETLGSERNAVLTIANLGIVSEFLGDLSAAEAHYMRARRMLVLIGADNRLDTPLQSCCATNLEYLQIRKREFDKARDGLQALLAFRGDPKCPRRVVALALEFLGELEMERGNNATAEECLAHAYEVTNDILPSSDVMTDVLRRQAQLYLCIGRRDDARKLILRCITLCRRIDDRVEFGIAARVLGEVWVESGRPLKARSCFDLAIRVLKGASEAPELMRTLYLAGRLLSREGQSTAAENLLHEASQLSRRMGIPYYGALIAIAFMDLLTRQERFDEANSWLNEASQLRDALSGIDRDRVDSELKRSANELQTAITRASVKAAETLKTICRVYEDARFPIAEIKPDLAYQVAQSVGAESLWVIGRKGGGYHVPITYNISKNEAKATTRQLDEKQAKILLGVGGDPRVLATPSQQTVVVTPCRDMDGRTNGYVTCARYETIVSVSPRQLEILCASAEALSRLIEDEDERSAPSQGEDEEPARIRHPRGSFKDVLTIDPEMIKLIRLAERAAGSVAPILLEGETGVGKELFARAIHASSQRKEGPFVAVNAGGMSVSLLESELFGHVKGAFTDARSERMGLVEMARGGSLFLDEIGEMGEEMQVKLLRLLENGEYRRLGESNTRKADVRVISATNRDLKIEADGGRFRRDLYYRVSPVKLTIPPLRMRSRDIQLMVRYFLRECAAMNGIADRFIEIDVKAMEALELYDWPGNVRELHNEILRVVSLIGKGDLVRFSMLSPSIKDYLQTKKRGDGLLERSVEQYERRLILRALENHEWNRMQTADAIGIPRTTLLAKLKRLNIASK